MWYFHALKLVLLINASHYLLYSTPSNGSGLGLKKPRKQDQPGQMWEEERRRDGLCGLISCSIHCPGGQEVEGGRRGISAPAPLRTPEIAHRLCTNLDETTVRGGKHEAKEHSLPGPPFILFPHSAGATRCCSLQEGPGDPTADMRGGLPG